MSGVTGEQVQAAREVDLLTYLQACQPWELKHSGPNEYRTVTHGSLVISNGKWYWNRGGFGGVSALDYLTKVCGLGFVEAVEAVSGLQSIIRPVSLSKYASSSSNKKKKFMLPPSIKYPARMLAYLQERGISAALIKRCMDANTLYEGRYDGESVCVFVGRDADGRARFGCMRGISSGLKRDCSGSDKRYSFAVYEITPLEENK